MSTTKFIKIDTSKQLLVDTVITASQNFALIGMIDSKGFVKVFDSVLKRDKAIYDFILECIVESESIINQVVVDCNFSISKKLQKLLTSQNIEVVKKIGVHVSKIEKLANKISKIY